MTMTPLRRLEGISYWVIEDPDAIYGFINTNIRKEWEADVRSVGENPLNDPWLRTLSERKWRLDIIDVNRIELSTNLMSYVNVERGYVFAEPLRRRRDELRKSIETYDAVIWPIIVREEDLGLVDGYCRYTTLREMSVSRIYAYLGCSR
jgi:hypothetical protein